MLFLGLLLFFVLPLDFYGRVRVVRSMYLPAALHGLEASLLASDSLRRLRLAVRRVVWSRRQPLASVGAVLGLLDGPTGCDPAFCVVLLRRYLALWLAEVGLVYRLLAMVREGCPGHGPVHLLSASASEIGFEWDPHALAWVRPGLPLLSHLAGPIQHFRAAVLDVWRNRVAADLCCRQGFRGGSLLDIHGSLQLLNSSHVRERDKALLRSIMVGGVWNGLLLGRVRSQAVPCRFCGARDNDGHLFWDCPFPPLVEIRENPEFHDLMRLDKENWPRCLLWHGWLPMLSGVCGASPWAADATESASYLLEVALGRYSSELISEWIPSDDFDHDMAASSLSDHPDVWTDGSLVLDHLIGVSSSGFGFFANEAEHFWRHRGVMLMMFVFFLTLRAVRVFVLFLGLFSLFRGLKSGTTTHNNTQQHTTTHNNTQQHTTTHTNTQPQQQPHTTTHNSTTTTKQQHNNNTQQHTTTQPHSHTATQPHNQQPTTNNQQQQHVWWYRS